MIAQAGTLDDWLSRRSLEFERAYKDNDVKRILNMNENRETPTKYMLHTACMRGGSNIAVALIDNGVDVDAQNVNGYSPLHWCAIKNDIMTTEKLLSVEAFVDCKDRNGFTPLSWASFYGYKKIVSLLLNKNSDINSLTNCQSSALHWSCASGHEDVSLMLLDAGINLNKINRKGETPLLLAYMNGHTKLAEKLIELGASMDIGATPPLCWATMNGHEDIALYLISKGAKCNVISNCGYSPLYSSCRRGCYDLVKRLLEKGCDPNCHVANDSRTPLHTAVVNGFTDILKLLLFYRPNNNKNNHNIKNSSMNVDVDINAMSTSGHAPLHFAFKRNRKDKGEIARLLVSCGANVYAQSKGLSGATALELAHTPEERNLLLDVYSRRMKWIRRRNLMMFLKSIGCLQQYSKDANANTLEKTEIGVEKEDDKEIKRTMKPEDVKAAEDQERKINTFELVHRHIVSFL